MAISFFIQISNSRCFKISSIYISGT